MQTKTIGLIAVLVLVGGAVWYLESGKPPASGVPAEHLGITDTSSSTPGVAAAVDRSAILKMKAVKYPSAVELVPGGDFINTSPFTLKSLIGKKVILMDFWTYSCINCLRTLPYLNSWYEKYKDQGLVIVGVHTPEFDFEKDLTNVAKAVKDLGITYPVVQDNNYATWNAYQNRYWPREYLIDIDGYIVHDHAGEGSYNETEKLIQVALEERALVLHSAPMPSVGIAAPKDVVTVDSSQLGSPETYFGSARNEYLGNGSPGLAGLQNLTIPQSQKPNTLYLGGAWNFQSQYAENSANNGEIQYIYRAKNVYLVASSDAGVEVVVYLDGKAILPADAGADVGSSASTHIKDNRLYKIVESKDYGVHVLKLIIKNPGLKAFTFTFG